MGFFAMKSIPGGPRWDGGEIFAVFAVPAISIGVGWAVRYILTPKA
jgi:hypothetical protein